jgi:SAM-dependent methyltransferase
MANRDKTTTQRKVERLFRHLPIGNHIVILDVGPGDGTLLRLISQRTARCCGVDPSAAAIERLQSFLPDQRNNIELGIGSATEIPYADATFDIVIVNSVLQLLATRQEARTAVKEAVRVCKPGGTIWVGELPFCGETDKGVVVRAWRKFRECGAANFVRLVWTIYCAPILRGEAIVTYPTVGLFVPVVEFLSWCSDLGLVVEVSRHQELRQQSRTRKDYLLRKPRA